ncbi:MAG: hypothetical protein ACI802_000966 [Candidatus Paceibacteria bacterium]
MKKGRFFAPPRAKRITTIIFPISVSNTEKAANYSLKQGPVATPKPSGD